jgi:hypothetical protein
MFCSTPHSGVNPKTIVCEFFKKGQCTKGAKCKFSHDLQDQRKSGKIDIYTDPREIGPNPPPQTISPDKVPTFVLSPQFSALSSLLL